MTTGQEIKEFRSRNGLTQQDFSRMMEVSAPTISRWEAGIDFPTRENLAKLKEFITDMEDKRYQLPERVFELYEWARQLDCEEQIIEMLGSGATILQLRMCIYLADNERLEMEAKEQIARAEEAEEKLSHYCGCGGECCRRGGE